MELPVEIDPSEVHQLLAPPSERIARLIDCREQDEWHICHLQGALLVPMSRIAELAPQCFTDPQEHLIVYCHHGMRSAQVAMFLQRQGFDAVFNLTGGIDAWSRDVDPSVPTY